MLGASAFVKRALPSSGHEESDELALVAIRDGISLKSRAAAFKGGSMLAWFGGISVDLREATLAPGAQLSVHTLFGGIDLTVPAEWRVESNAKSLAGGVEVTAAADEGPETPLLKLDGLAVFGGVAVNARTKV